MKHALRISAMLLLSGVLWGQKTEELPLHELPYSPSLDRDSMDRSIDPCQDFYTYACGGWIKANPIPPDQASWDVYSKLADQNRRLLWGLLQEAAKPDPNRSAIQQKTGDYFNACMDEAAIEKAGASPLKPELDAIAMLRSVRDLPAFLGRENLFTNGSGMMFGFGSSQDFENSDRVIAFAFAGGIGLPDRDYYVKSDAKSREIQQRYALHVQKMFELLGDSPSTAARNSRTVMKLETALAKASLTDVEQRDPYKLFHRMTLPQVRQLTPAFDWTQYLAAQGLQNITEINVTEPGFFRELQSQLGTNGIDKWRTYLRWHLVNARAPYLSKNFVDEDFDFHGKYLRGVAEIQPRWKRCVRYVDRDLGEALGQMYVQKTFSPAIKERTLEMTQAIEKAMETDLSQLPWMGDATRQQGLLKLHSMVNKIGYPNHWRDYGSVHIVPDDFAGDAARAAEFESRRDLAKIGRPVDREEWGMPPPTVNAYYDAQTNDINFPAGVLQPPLFDPKLDDAPNYGNTGGTIGHELTHGFDDQGRLYDAKGNLRDWWSKEDAAQFQQRVKCVTDQYAQYTVVDGIKVNSQLTVGEDVADLGGLILAYMAWKDTAKGQELKAIDGFQPDQRFFIGFAQWACGSERPEQKRASAIDDPHSPDEYRINGVVSNMPEFARAFGCKAGQPMVRQNACRVW